MKVPQEIFNHMLEALISAEVILITVKDDALSIRGVQ